MLTGCSPDLDLRAGNRDETGTSAGECFASTDGGDLARILKNQMEELVTEPYIIHDGIQSGLREALITVSDDVNSGEIWEGPFGEYCSSLGTSDNDSQWMSCKWKLSSGYDMVVNTRENPFSGYYSVSTLNGTSSINSAISVTGEGTMANAFVQTSIIYPNGATNSRHTAIETFDCE